MSVIGIDLGNYKCTIGIARNKNIDILANENSNRSTKNIISIKEDFRTIGDNAQPLLITNYKNTYYSIKHLLGKKYNNIDTSIYPFDMIQKEDGYIGYKYNDEILDDIQLIAMLLSKFKEQIVLETSSTIGTIVIPVPPYFNNLQRKLLKEAGKIINLDIEIISEYIASAIDYGIWKAANKEFSDELAHLGLFINIGEYISHYTLMSFHNTALDTRVVISDDIMCGRNIDLGIYKILETQLKAKIKLDLSKNKKTQAKLLVEAEKIKKQFSMGTKTIKSTIEYIYQEEDLVYSISYEDYLQILEPLLNNLKTNLQKILKSEKLDEKLQFIELIGGSTRIPIIRETVHSITQVKPSTTLNTDETIAKGAAIYAAIISGRFKFFDYLVSDIYMNNVDIENSNKEDFDRVELLTSDDVLSKKKRIRFKYKDGIILKINENNQNILEFKNIKFNKEEERINIYLDIGLDGIVKYNNCDYYYKEKNEEGKVKKIVEKLELSNIDKQSINIEPLIEYEKNKIEKHNDILFRNEKKNDFENLLLNTRMIVENSEIELDKDKIYNEIDRLEDWLYEQDLYTLEEYDNVISEFHSIIEPINQQKIEIQVIKECTINLEQHISVNYTKTNYYKEDKVLIESYSKLKELCNSTQLLVNETRSELDNFEIGKKLSKNILEISNKTNEITEEFKNINSTIYKQEKDVRDKIKAEEEIKQAEKKKQEEKQKQEEKKR
jgi:molecular chaperone DnaK (HSP70)